MNRIQSDKVVVSMRTVHVRKVWSSCFHSFHVIRNAVCYLNCWIFHNFNYLQQKKRRGYKLVQTQWRSAANCWCSTEYIRISTSPKRHSFTRLFQMENSSFILWEKPYEPKPNARLNSYHLSVLCTNVTWSSLAGTRHYVRKRSV